MIWLIHCWYAWFPHNNWWWSWLQWLLDVSSIYWERNIQITCDWKRGQNYSYNPRYFQQTCTFKYNFVISLWEKKHSAGNFCLGTLCLCAQCIFFSIEWVAFYVYLELKFKMSRIIAKSTVDMHWDSNCNQFVNIHYWEFR